MLQTCNCGRVIVGEGRRVGGWKGGGGERRANVSRNFGSSWDNKETHKGSRLGRCVVFWRNLEGCSCHIITAVLWTLEFTRARVGPSLLASPYSAPMRLLPIYGGKKPCCYSDGLHCHQVHPVSSTIQSSKTHNLSRCLPRTSVWTKINPIPVDTMTDQLGLCNERVFGAGLYMKWSLNLSPDFGSMWLAHKPMWPLCDFR